MAQEETERWAAEAQIVQKKHGSSGVRVVDGPVYSNKTSARLIEGIQARVGQGVEVM